MLSTTTKHALRALMILATRDQDEVMLGRDLAGAAAIPVNYLGKILVELGKAGLVKATRGTGGGYCLALPPEQIPLIKVVEVFEGALGCSTCLLDSEHACSDDHPCSAHVLWRDVQQAYTLFLEKTTVHDIAMHR